MTEQQTAELYELVVEGSDLATDKVVRWRYVDLLTMVKRRFSVEVHESTIGKWLHQIRLTRLQVGLLDSEHEGQQQIMDLRPG